MNFFRRTRRWCGLLVLLAAPLHAQELTPVSSVAVPTLRAGEFVFGLGSTGTDLLLVSTLTFYTSPLDAGGSTSFTSTAILMEAFGVSTKPTSLLFPIRGIRTRSISLAEVALLVICSTRSSFRQLLLFRR